MTDIVKAGSVVAIAAADNNTYDYYLFKVSSDGAMTLNEPVVDDYNSAYEKGSLVLKGNFFLRDNLIDMTYKLDNKSAVVYAKTVRAICGDLKQKKKRKNLFISYYHSNMRR